MKQNKTLIEIKKEYYTLVNQEWGNLLHDRLDDNVSGQMSKSSLIIEFIWNIIQSTISQTKQEMELINGDRIENTWEAGLKVGRKQGRQELIEEMELKFKNAKDKLNQPLTLALIEQIIFELKEDLNK